jgi:hypothetical protein
MRACLVSGPPADLDEAGSDRLRTGLADFRAAERFVAFGLVLGLVMGSSEVYAAPSAAPPQPRPGNFTRQGRTLKRALAFRHCRHLAQCLQGKLGLECGIKLVA